MVTSAVPFQLITELLIKFEPVIVKVKEGLPADTLEGDKLVIAGTGLLPAVMVNGSELLFPPPGAALDTVTAALPAVAIIAAVIVAESCVALT